MAKNPGIPAADAGFTAAFQQALRDGLADDGWQWDWTTLGIPATGNIRARIMAKSDGVWAGDALIAALGSVSAELGSPIRANPHVLDGQALKKGQLLVEWEGPQRMILAMERPFLNLASYAGGIATATRRLVVAVDRAWRKVPARIKANHETPRVCSTRKTLPGYRGIAVQSVRAGGGSPHRIGLSSGILIKENHIAASGGIAAAVRHVVRTAPHGLKTEIEVRDLDELAQAIEAGVDGVLLDNFKVPQLRAALKEIEKSGRRPFVEVSGGLDESSIGKFALPGVHVLSAGSITHSVRSLDLSLLVDR